MLMSIFASEVAKPGEKAQIDPFHHVADADHIEIFHTIGLDIPLPSLGLPFGATKFLLFLLIVALMVGAMMFWLANKVKSGETPKGKLWNFIESILFFIRDKIARPALGNQDADKYVAFLTTLFLFIFFCNAISTIPFLPSPTAHIYVTGALSLIVFLVIHITGFREHGIAGYLKTFIPHIHIDGDGIVPKIGSFFLVFGMAILEYFTAFLRNIILAIRLFANILAGHTALYMIMFFIRMVDDPSYKVDIAEGWMFWPVSLASVSMLTALGVLELFIAGLQAFVFTFLSAIFIGLAKHPAH